MATPRPPSNIRVSGKATPAPPTSITVSRRPACSKTYPGAKFDNGKAVHCNKGKGHTGKHFNSFAMRSW
jgi:hypothetical protein